MCSRFELDTPANALKKRFRLKGAAPRPNKAEMRPTDLGLIVLASDEGPRFLPVARIATWGLQPDWGTRGRPLINARAETIETKPTFRPLLRTRCIVPASAYFEWRPAGRLKLKNRIADADGEVLAFAGLLDLNSERFTIITCPPAPEIAHIHDRMPVLLTEDEDQAWLDPELSFDQVKGLLRPKSGLIAVETPPPAHKAPKQTDLFG